MNAAQRAQTVYGDATTFQKTPSQVEYQAFAKITKALTGAAKEANSNFPRLAEALHENIRLWTIVAAGVAVDENELPPALRAQLFYLAEFTRAHTSKILKGEADAAALIDINTAVMKGLRQQDSAPCPA